MARIVERYQANHPQSPLGKGGSGRRRAVVVLIGVLLAVVAAVGATEPFMVKDINPFGSSQPWWMAALGDRVLFNGDDGVHGQELWISDGTEFGTRLVKDIVPGLDGFVPSQLVPVGDLMFFVGDDNINGFEFWVSDGTAAGTLLPMDIDPSTEGNPPQVCGLFSGNVGAVGNTFFFRWDDGIHGNELWKSNGTTPGTVLVKDLNPGPGDGNINVMAAIDGSLFFVGIGGMWKSDGTEAGTIFLKTVFGGDFIELNGIAFFRGDDFSGETGFELWKSDGTPEGTVLVKDINPGPFFSNVTHFGVIGDRVYFAAATVELGFELWTSDGTEQGTFMVKEINPTGSGGPGSKPVSIGDVLFFRASDGVNGSELWKTDGTPEGTVMVKDINPTGSSTIQSMVNAHGTIYFSADDGVNGRELWKSDGTETGTVMVGEVFPGPEDGLGLNNAHLTVAGDFVFFKGYDGVNGVELWAMDVVEPITEGKIPTVSHWGLVVLGLLTLTAGTVLLRRRRVVMGALAMTFCVGAGFAVAQRPPKSPPAPSATSLPSNVRHGGRTLQKPKTVEDAAVIRSTAADQRAALRAAEVAPVWMGTTSSGQPTVRIKINVLDLRAGIRQVGRQIQMLRRIFGLAGVGVKVTLQMIDDNELGDERHPIDRESKATETMSAYLDRPETLLNVFVTNHEIDADRDGKTDRALAYTLAAPSGGEPRAGLMVHWKEVADETVTLVHSIVHFVGLPGPRGAEAAAWLQRHGLHEGCEVCVARSRRDASMPPG